MGRRVIAGAGVAALLALTGCGGVEPDAVYYSSEEVVNAAISAGYDCTDPRPSDAPVRDEAHPSWECLSEGRDQFVAYLSHGAAEEGREGFILGAQLVMSSSRVEQSVLFGPNWAIRAPVEDAEALQEEMGGYMPDLSDVRVPGLTD